MGRAMQATPEVTPEIIIQLTTGAWASALVEAGVRHSIFTLISRGDNTVESLTGKSSLAPRGAQILLDGLVGVGLLRVSSGVYANSAEAATFLVLGTSNYLGDYVMAEVASLPMWSQLARAMSSGQPAESPIESSENPFWDKLVLGIAPLSFPMAQAVVKELELARAGEISILDIGGGSGIYSGVLLSANVRARSTQIDWPRVNRIAREYVARFGVSDRFVTVDGDLHSADYGTRVHDVVICSHIAHMESPRDNTAIFRKAHEALRPNGTLVVNDFVLSDDRSGPAFGLIFSSNMLLRTAQGSSWREADYRAWLVEAGFAAREIRLLRTPGPASLFFARRTG
jgi:2-polyprenyl-3-methyl-5-hydroxy-6-metoxy-1,4-benzoquinol methylase